MPWGTISWNSDEPAGTSVTVQARSSNDGSTWSAWESAGNGIDLTATPAGQYIQIEATLQITSGDISPILYDLTVLPANQPPVASFAYNCLDITCSFDASGSSDPDGSIVHYAWDFGDGNTGSGVTASHIYAAPGTYSVVLSVTDDDGATDSDTQNVTVSDGSMTLTATGYKVKGVHYADLEWSGAGSSDVDIYRDGANIGPTANDGFYTDNIGNKGGGSYIYRVCESGTTTCSNEATVTF